MCMHRIFIATVLLAALAAGCQPTKPAGIAKYETVPLDPRRDTDAARRHNAEGIRLINDGQLAGAEKVLKTACQADVFFGPAHNNLGTVYYRQARYYLAAWEFQYAAKLMPNSCQPQNNLGMVFEAVGKLDEAAERYDKALALNPDDVQTTGNLARLHVRTGRKDEKTRQLLNELVMKDTRPQWVEWAKQRLALMGQIPPAPPGPPPGP